MVHTYTYRKGCILDSQTTVSLYHTYVYLYVFPETFISISIWVPGASFSNSVAGIIGVVSQGNPTERGSYPLV